MRVRRGAPTVAAAYLGIVLAVLAWPAATQAMFCIASMDTPYVAGSQGTASAMESLASLITTDIKSPVALYTIGSEEDCATVYALKANTSSTVIPKDVTMHCETLKHYGAESHSPLTDYARASVMIGQWLHKHVPRDQQDSATCHVLITHEFNAPLSHIDMAVLRHVQTVTVVHGNQLWGKAWQARFNHNTVNFFDLQMNQFDRQSVQRSTHVVYPSAYMKEYHFKAGWGVYGRSSHVLHNLVLGLLAEGEERHGQLAIDAADGGAGDVRVDSATPAKRTGGVKGLAYVGVVGDRKGFDLFAHTAIEYARATQQTNIFTGKKTCLPCYVFGKLGSIQRHSIAAYIRFLVKDNKDVGLNILLQHQMPRVAMWKKIRDLGLVVVYPSRHENSPMVPIEAGINRVPFIGLNAGGIREIIENHEKVVVNFSTIGELRTVRSIASKLQEMDRRPEHMDEYVPDVLSKMRTDKLVWVAFLKGLHQNATNQMASLDKALLAETTDATVEILAAPLDKAAAVLEQSTSASQNGRLACRKPPSPSEYVILFSRDKWMLHSTSKVHLKKHIADFKGSTGVLPDAVVTNAYDLQGRLVIAGFPFLLTQWKWLLCYPVMPLTLKSEALCEYLQTHDITEYNATVLLDVGVWFHKKRKRVHQVQDAVYTLAETIVNAQDCLGTHMYTQGFKVTEMHEPFSSRKIIGHLPDVAQVIESHCSWTRHDAQFQGWMDAAVAPVLCNSDAKFEVHRKKQERSAGKHLLKDYDADVLRGVLAQHCGLTCVRHPSADFKGGWQIATGGCWMVVADASVCDHANSRAGNVAEKKRWHNKPHHIRREYFSEELLPYVPLRKLAEPANATCDLVRHGNQRVCGPQVLLGGDPGCGIDAVAKFLNAHRRISLRTCVDEAAQFCAQSQAFDPTYGSRSWASIESIDIRHTDFFAHVTQPDDTSRGHADTNDASEIAETDGVNTLTFAFLPNATRFGAAETANLLLPRAKVVYMVCDPATRLREEHYAAVAGSSPSSFIDLVRQLKHTCGDSTGAGDGADACDPLHRAMLTRGMHSEHLKPWLEHFKDRVLVLDLATVLTNMREHAANQNPDQAMSTAQEKEREHAQVRELQHLRGRDCTRGPRTELMPCAIDAGSSAHGAGRRAVGSPCANAAGATAWKLLVLHPALTGTCLRRACCHASCACVCTCAMAHCPHARGPGTLALVPVPGIERDGRTRVVARNHRGGVAAACDFRVSCSAAGTVPSPADARGPTGEGACMVRTRTTHLRAGTCEHLSRLRLATDVSCVPRHLVLRLAANMRASKEPFDFAFGA